jgi:ssRNA-specific RNase YbeY (16S rRNA maturation enzyme)
MIMLFPHCNNCPQNGDLDLDEDAGVSREMATKFTLEERIPLLFIHGMLHLLG